MNSLLEGRAIETVLELHRCSFPAGCQCAWHRAVTELGTFRVLVALIQARNAANSLESVPGSKGGQ